MSLKQETFDYLMKLEKSFVDDDNLVVSGAWSRELVSSTSKDSFIVDFHRGKLEFRKVTLNKRYRTSIVMLRLCTWREHTNPDGDKVSAPHVHLYKEGYGDRFAYPAGELLGLSENFTTEQAITNFLNHCNVIKIPSIQTSLGA